MLSSWPVEAQPTAALSWLNVRGEPRVLALSRPPCTSSRGRVGAATTASGAAVPECVFIVVVMTTVKPDDPRHLAEPSGHSPPQAQERSMLERKRTAVVVWFITHRGR